MEPDCGCSVQLLDVDVYPIPETTAAIINGPTCLVKLQ